MRYQNTYDKDDIVTLADIIDRYIQINETHEGLAEYIESGFIGGIEVEYVPYEEEETK